MSKRVKKVILILMLSYLAMFVVGCGQETYRCGWCTQEVTQKPHNARILGQETKLCDRCYEGIKNMQTELD